MTTWRPILLDQVFPHIDLELAAAVEADVLLNTCFAIGADDNAGLGRCRTISRCGIHFTSTSAAWLNLIETCFGILTRQAIRLGSIGRVKEVVEIIDTSTQQLNAGATPFVWVKTASEMPAMAVRKRPATSDSGHWSG